jgi:hypothetical protein
MTHDFIRSILNPSYDIRGRNEQTFLRLVHAPTIFILTRFACVTCTVSFFFFFFIAYNSLGVRSVDHFAAETK